MIAESIQAAAGRLLVMPGTGSNSTAEAIRLTKYAAKAGANAALVVGPYYNRPTQQGIYEHFKAIAESVDIPIGVYNIPARTGRNIEPETIIRLASLPGIAMLKEATGLMDQASQVLAATDLTVLSGDDSMTLPLLAIGGRGVISVVGNLVPADDGQISRYKSGLEKCFKAALDAGGWLLPAAVRGPASLCARGGLFTGARKGPRSPAAARSLGPCPLCCKCQPLPHPPTGFTTIHLLPHVDPVDASNKGM